ncbi:hypothetical protein F5Y16DRAFT_383517 [Xylariaceae sp. FL0255]|nr:hypothetical protein F5Y16DRAFT_383517 [Xylariaceae sp. FL0255]
MDEPDDGCSWQAWKFGMKREDLYTKLQDQYNTLAFSIQDPDAFHHDVCEISKLASDTHEFHQMLSERKQLRLDQLRESFESAAVEIIANPKLIGTDQWQHAIQLFRTRSFDSLVRYFSSYLPEDHDWATNTPFFDDLDDPTPIMTHEPLSFMSDTPANLIPASHLPPSPRSLTTCSDSSSVSTPSRTHSFSEPESDLMALSTTLTQDYDDYTSQWDDEPDTPITSISDLSDFESSQRMTDDRHDDISNTKTHEEPELTSSTQEVTESIETPLLDLVDEDIQGSETPTPNSSKQTKTNLAAAIHIQPSNMSPSPALPAALSRKYTPLQQRVRDVSPGLSRIRRRSPEIGRIQKPSIDQTRIRPKSHKR